MRLTQQSISTKFEKIRLKAGTKPLDLSASCDWKRKSVYFSFCLFFLSGKFEINKILSFEELYNGKFVTKYCVVLAVFVTNWYYFVLGIVTSKHQNWDEIFWLVKKTQLLPPFGLDHFEQVKSKNHVHKKPFFRMRNPAVHKHFHSIL